MSTTDHVIALDGGLYSLADINAELADYSESMTTISDAALSFVGHGPTQIVIADWDAEAATYGAILRFSETDSIASLLGYAATDLTYEIGEGGKHKYFRSPSPANFDAVSLYLLKCSVLSGQNYDASGPGGGQVACAITQDPGRGPGESDPISAVDTPPVPGARFERQSDELDSVHSARQQQRASGFERGVHRADSDQLVSYEKPRFF